MSWYRRHGKRLFDVALVVASSPVTVPAALVVAGLVRVALGPGVLFRQQRPGLHGRPFTILKFRTMCDARDRAERLLPDEERLGRSGRMLRSMSLDELPELWNVFRGDMSLVGPRPLLMEYLDRYNEEQARRHEVKPGITGWAQVNGRNALTWEQKFELDVWYVDNSSLRLDLKILMLTIWHVLRPNGIAAEGYATMPEFMGTDVCDTRPEGEQRQ